jgi:DNA-binding transcriptional LysR family regulator
MGRVWAGDAALELGVSQAAVSRTLLSLERVLGARLLHRTNSSTGGLAEGLCDLAVVRTPPDERRFASAVVGQERRYCALPADDPWARRRSLRLEDVGRRTGRSTGGPAAPPPTCGRPAASRRSSTPATSTTGWR